MLQIVCYLINLLLMQQNEWVNFLNKGFLSFFFLKSYISNYAMGSSQFMERSEQRRVANTRMRVKLTSCAHGRDFFLASYP